VWVDGQFVGVGVAALLDFAEATESASLGGGIRAGGFPDVARGDGEPGLDGG